VRPAAVRAQADAIAGFHRGDGDAWHRLEDLTQPILFANGAHDVLMIHAYQSYAATQRLPNATLILYGDAGHGFLFQHAEAFGNAVLGFLR